MSFANKLDFIAYNKKINLFLCRDKILEKTLEIKRIRLWNDTAIHKEYLYNSNSEEWWYSYEWNEIIFYLTCKNHLLNVSNTKKQIWVQIFS